MHLSSYLEMKRIKTLGLYEDIYNELEEIAMKDENLRHAIENWGDISMTQEQSLAYEGRLKQIYDEAAFKREMELLEQEMKEVKEELAKAEMAEKEAANAEKLAIACRLLEAGMEIEFVAKSTGLEINKVFEIQKKMK